MNNWELLEDINFEHAHTLFMEAKKLAKKAGCTRSGTGTPEVIGRNTEILSVNSQVEVSGRIEWYKANQPDMYETCYKRVKKRK